MENKKPISLQTLKRLPIYLQYLKALQRDSVKHISSTSIALALGQNDVQVRKDLASVSDRGKPKIGYVLIELISDIESYLGYDNVQNAVIVGAGNLGRALLCYHGFSNYNLDIVAAFDNNDDIIGKMIKNKQIFSINKLKNLCERMKIKIGIITVPDYEAQKVCDLMVESGILAIWNFAPINLNVPKEVIVQNENIGSSLAILSKHLKEKLYK
ncbi:redox-sensing transcriptional repressor [Lachnotalea glycerini]|uniref:Redox-sensing transcriptional repressor Rex n=1 Tax=Lachnotalea glycerini TaxID=1763509 RepID=A0A255I467_9FIRM|nr:redox-sensing transcriptional repressor Rex [Lachnotalea glycerini]PXV93827.1 redox-sensing transcriptional repressor [Lachnotalea glycerini]RDY30933.1 redox-sensing transcriptional repressor Rex [Lachnotalea glycerini]